MATRPLRKIHLGNPADTHIKALLTAWLKSVERYNSVFDADCCWWYNERASLSTLAGAAWSMPGWVALEEYATDKRGKVTAGGVEAGKLKRGRCDLVISNHEASLAIEAKQAWQPIGSKGDDIAYVTKAMAAAMADVNCLYSYEADRFFAATFIVPVINLQRGMKAGCSKADRDRRIKEALDAWIPKVTAFNAPAEPNLSWAYLFPNTGSACFTLNDRHFPGVILVLKEMRPRL